MSDSAWRDTIPLVAVHHEVFTPTAIGHRGGPPVQRRPVTIWDVIDAAERYLDEHGLERPHLAGNSMGGFVALELARRGRAQSVSAFSPAGLWSDALRARVIKRVRRATAMTRIARDIAPLVMKPPPLRPWAMRDLAWHGDRISAARAVEAANDRLACSIIDDVFRKGDEQVVAKPTAMPDLPSHGRKKTPCFPSSCTKPPARSACPARSSQSCPASATCQCSTIRSLWRGPSSP
ncbi:MAG: alpha/beta fold hydrolase [Mycobacterium sp.]|uniref:alpha/beta fold hydrolase n=1 Tax=Mycobacterium sp. TaxID=1785 RepID=UPI003C63907B